MGVTSLTRLPLRGIYGGKPPSQVVEIPGVGVYEKIYDLPGAEPFTLVAL